MDFRNDFAEIFRRANLYQILKRNDRQSPLKKQARYENKFYNKRQIYLSFIINLADFFVY